MNLTLLALATAALSAGARFEAPSPEEAPQEPETSVVEEVSAEGEEASEEAPFDFGEFVKEYLPANLIASLISIITAVTAIVKLVASNKALAKARLGSVDDTVKTVVETLKSNNIEATIELIKPLAKQVESLSKVNEQFAKVLALSQDGSPEARIAILNLIAEIGNVDTKKLVEDTKAEVERQAEESKAKLEETKAKMDEIASKKDDGTTV